MAMPRLGLRGDSHLMGGYAGAEAEYVRVPFADVGPLKIRNGLTDEEEPFSVRHLPYEIHGGG